MGVFFFFFFAMYVAQRHNTRAILTYDGVDDTIILADRGVVFDGSDGEEFLRLTMDALSQVFFFF